MGDNDYLFAVARIHVKEKTLLSDMDVAQMAGMKTEQDVLNFLTDRGWGDGSSPVDAAGLLAAEEAKTWDLMRELRIDPAVFQVLELPKLYHNLGCAIKEAVLGKVPERVYFDIDKYDGETMGRIVREKRWEDLPSHMKETARNAYELMAKTGDGQRCDSIVDRGCILACLEAGKKSKNSLLAEYEESMAAVTDIKIAVRAARTGKTLNFLNEALAPCSQVDVRYLALAAAEGQEKLLSWLEEHGFGKAAEALKDSPSAFERWCDNRVIETILPQKRKYNSQGPVIAYYLARENEIKTARIILTAKANGFSEEFTKERVRRMYG